MQAEAALGRVGLWLLIMVLSIVMVATAADSGMAAHATIIGVIAFVMVWVTAAGFDSLGKAQGFFKMPEGLL